jgi:hypothetical protein
MENFACKLSRELPSYVKKRQMRVGLTKRRKNLLLLRHAALSSWDTVTICFHIIQNIGRRLLIYYNSSLPVSTFRSF